MTVNPSPTRTPRKATVREKAGYYKASFKLSKVGDTFIDMSTWGKGFVWVNGHCLGRFWEIGPQQTLYCPGCWLKKGQNEIIVMDILGPEEAKTAGLATPIIDKLNKSGKSDAVKIDKKNKAKAADAVLGNDAAPGA